MLLGEYLQTIGPNRRSERTVIEQQLQPDATELDLPESRWNETRKRVLERLQSVCGCRFDSQFSGVVKQGEPLATLAGLFNQSALALQIAAGHRVAEAGYCEDTAGKGVWAWFEFEHEGVGFYASRLALRLILDATPEISLVQGEGETGAVKTDVPLDDGITRFLHFARTRVLPLDAEAIIEAANRRDISCFKLERDPYPGVEGDFRVRPNGLLMLGHCASRQLVDGTLCLTRNANLAGMFRNRKALRELLQAEQAPVPRQNPEAGNCVMANRAVRAAETLGYPVVVKSGQRVREQGVFLNLESGDDVKMAVDRARKLSSEVMVEAMVPGDSHEILLVGQKPLALIKNGAAWAVDEVHNSILDLAARVASKLGCGLLAIDVVTPDISKPLNETGGAVVGLELAPELDRLLASEPEWLLKAADSFVQWLYPGGENGRVPILAVTGTNGKTTTCRMMSRILQQAGRYPAMVCSEGVYFDGAFSATRNELGHAAHHHVFENPQVNAVVFEEYFGRIARAGFAYSWCDVAVCTNVTADHLGRIGAHTLDEMAKMKEEVPRRARHAVVLNADDPRCLDMAGRATAAKIGLVSMLRKTEELTTRTPEATCTCVIENHDGEDWLVLYDAGKRQSVIRVAQIPATFDGAAGHNTSNAMHAALACYLAGVEIPAIADGLGGFAMSFEDTPGRMNVFDGLPFRVIMDYAHNVDGYKRLCAFTDQQAVRGKKILMFGINGDRQDRDILAPAVELAGHFDHYICRNYQNLRGREAHEVPQLLKTGLMSAGVDEQAISPVPDHQEAVHVSLDKAEAGDLLVLLVGHTEFDDVWALLRSRAA